MDTLVKKSNKENSKPEASPKKPESRNLITKQKQMRPAPLRSKNHSKEQNAGNKTEPKAQVKPSQPAKSHESDPTQRKTLSHAFRTQQTLRHRKLVLETQKPPLSVPHKPLLPGTYKGRVVQSKIDCFRKPPCGHDKKPSENKPNAKTAVRSKSVAALSASSRTGFQSTASSRMKSASDVGVSTQKMIPQRRIQAKAPAQTTLIANKTSTLANKTSTLANKTSTLANKTSTLANKTSTLANRTSTHANKTSTISRKPLMMSTRPPTVTSFIKKNKPSKPDGSDRTQNTQKSVSSTISQYRVHMETAEERRVKLAEWLASKGKTLKRPAKSVPQSCKPRLRADEEEEIKQAEAVRVSETEQSEVPQRKPVFSNSPSHILNTTLDLLDNSDPELQAEPDIRMESLVVNLCEQLEAMEMLSSCESDIRAGGNSDTQVKVEEVTPEYEILEEKQLSEEQWIMDTVPLEKKEEDDGRKKKTLKVEEEKKVFEDDEEEDEKEEMDSTPAEDLDACVVKYSVKTTPYLQSVKKRMAGELVQGTPGSRHKNSIKELKFLTPVRRSSRIHKNSSRLPGMLNEHDPCVSSLVELELLDSTDSNAYIYRKNPALLQHLPDQHPEPHLNTPANKHAK